MLLSGLPAKVDHFFCKEFRKFTKFTLKSSRELSELFEKIRAKVLKRFKK